MKATPFSGAACGQPYVTDEFSQAGRQKEC